ncbi:MAG: phosphopantetheine-binding protein [Lachnospiraceae bacterium]|nr:phosphopantetheine-binding protein [Lachnospiraceae bacterium]
MDIIKELFQILEMLGTKPDIEDENSILQMYIADSYMQVKFTIEVEKKFGVEIPERLLLAVEDITLKQLAEEIKTLKG